MDILFLLVPMSVLLVFGLLALFRWALSAGQFDDLEREGERIFDPRLDDDQAFPTSAPEQ